MNNVRNILFLWVIVSVAVCIFSYAFIDAHLVLSHHALYQTYITPLSSVIRSNSVVTAGIFVIFLGCLFILWWKTFQIASVSFWKFRHVFLYMLCIYTALVFSYPFLSYDVFNYIATAKVSFTWHENPYVVMPIEIPNDPNLLFTRAANKVALYGPFWLFLTWIPHTLGMGQIWQSIIAFKLMSAVWYFIFCYLIFRITKSMKNVVFFALNPLVLMETIVCGHNDMVMMVLSISGLILWQQKTWIRRSIGLFLFISSFFIKGATVVLFPLLFFRTITRERLMFIASCLLFFVFVTLAPLREELYPWYAIWFFSTAAFLPYPKYLWVWEFCAALSIGLELRHMPYMIMGYYEGPGPILRTALTLLPVVMWAIWYRIKNKKKETS